jgi:hypothetical protein
MKAGILRMSKEILTMSERDIKEKAIHRKMTMIYWKEDNFWLGKLLEHPEIMTQGLSLEELEINLKDAYLMMAMDDVPTDYRAKEITI